MRAVLWGSPAWIDSARKRLSGDRADEMWEGVLHVGPDPNTDHQRLGGQLLAWLVRWWEPLTGGTALHECNVAHPAWAPDRWTSNYRSPDLLLLRPERAGIDRNEYLCGGPDVVVEIRSPGDETDAKTAFYADVGVREMWVIDRDTKAIEVRVLDAPAMTSVRADDHGWSRSRAADVELRRLDEHQIAIRLRVDPESETAIPPRRE